jgi:putative proteasome-type protease
MTYCVAVMVDAGMVFASDSRTNAGVDQISTYRKMHTVKKDGDRVIAMLSSGNLSITQSSINLLEHQSRTDPSAPNIYTATSMFEIADLVGDAVREVHRRDGPYMLQNNIEAHASFIVGGQIKGEHQRLFHVYSEGNFIEATPETPYFQIGESKYGKPVIDRVINHTTGLLDAAKCLLVSFDSTMRSNVSVGLPIDVLVYKNGALKPAIQRRIDEADSYFNMIHNKWGEGLKQVFAQIPNPEWDEAA